MSAASRLARRLGLVVTGFVMGILGLALGVWFYLEAGRVEQARTDVGEDVLLARERAERIDAVADTAVRFELADVVLREARDTVLASRALTMTLDPETLGGTGPIEFRDVTVDRPVARIIQSPDGEWNYERAFGLTDPARTTDGDESRPLLFRNVTLASGRLRLLMPAGPPPEEGAVFVPNLAATNLGGITYNLYDVSGVAGNLSSARIGGPDGWRVEFTSLRGDLAQPDMILSARGWAEQEGVDAVVFDIDQAEVGGSTLASEGMLTFTENGFLYDLRLVGAPLQFVDFRPLLPNLPAEGGADFDVDILSISPERLSLDFRELDVDAMGSRIVGRLGVAVGGEIGPSLLSAEVDLAPLRLAALEELGMVRELPVTGVVEGRLTTAGVDEGFASVDLTATLVPRDEPEAAPSVVQADGAVALAGAAEELTLDGMTLGFVPLRPATFAALMPERREMLRGIIDGSIVLGGTLREVHFADGILEYEVGNAAPTRLSGITGRATLSPELSYEINAVAQPLSLATVNELFPAAPFRSATVTGPVAIVGGPESITVDGDLTGPAGGIDFQAAIRLGDPLGFDVAGTVSALETGMLLRPELDVEGPLRGTFAASGTTESLTFDVDLEHRDGRFDLSGSAVPTADPPIVNVQGDVAAFNIGTLLGDPLLFAERMSGPIVIRGGGGTPYTFDLDLRGDSALLELEGFFEPGDVPSYRVTGEVAGLDLSRLPLARQLPSSSLSTTIDVDARGADLETLEGTFSFDASRSILGGRQLDAALGDVEIRAGVLYIDTLDITYDRNRFAATGTWGLRTPSQEPLRYSLTAPDLASLGRLLTPIGSLPLRLNGSVSTSGVVAGSIEYPVIDGVVDVREIRYGDFSATSIGADLDISHTPDGGWSGEMVVEGTEVVFPGGEGLQSLRLNATGDRNSIAFDLDAALNGQTSLAASGSLEVADLRPRAAALDQLSLSLAEDTWSLTRPAGIRFSQEEGLAVDDLLLQRSGPGGGLISVDGRIPPTGTADLAIHAENLDLSNLQYISRRMPVVEGVFSLDAVITGPQANPEMTIAGRLADFAYEGASAESIVFDGTYVNQRFEGAAEANAAGARLFRADVSVPMLLSFEHLVPSLEDVPDAPLQMTIVADSLPLDLLAALAPGMREGTGVARALINVTGTTDAPELEGSARLDDGAVFIEPLGVRYSDIDVDLELAGSRLSINSLSARSGGTLVVSGVIDFPSGVTPRFELSASMDGFRVMNDRTKAELSASGELAIAGPADEPVVTGNVSISESTIFVPELATSEPTLELGYLDAPAVGPLPPQEVAVGPGFLGNLRIDGVELRVGESVWLQSNEMRVQITGDLIVFRSGEDLRVFGGLEAMRGTYTLEISGIARSFDVVSGRVQFFGTGDLNPSLDITAGYRVRQATVGSGGDVTILVQLSGTLLSPRIQLTSDTAVPLAESDLISYLIFGRPNFELGGVNAGFAQQVLVQEVVGGIVASRIEPTILRRGLCDWVRVRAGAPSTLVGFLQAGTFTNAAIECGWELASDFFLTGQTGLGLFSGERAEGRLGLEWQIDSQWMWAASYGAVQRSPLARIFDTGVRTQFSTDIRRQWEYGRPSPSSSIELLTEDEPLPPPVEEDAPGGPVPQP